VVGGGYIGCEISLHMAQMGKKVEIVEMLPGIGLDVGPIDKMGLLKLLTENKVKWHTGMRVDKITEDGVIACDKDGREQKFQASSVILATGMRPNDALFEDLEGKVAELYKIGDVIQPRKVFHAIHEAEAIACLF
jgi:pyruvate/2-oxoglutarate dehydrogenase complex dihydrolipoamide dehydrogenase (E3) component